MFESPQSRYLLRAGVATGLGALGALQVALIDGSFSALDGVAIATATLTVAGGYLGIGAASGSMEPFVGNKHSDPDVPIPPAQPEDPAPNGP